VQLGIVQGGTGMFQQGVRLFAIIGVQADTDAAGQVYFITVDFGRLGNSLDNPVGDLVGELGAIQSGEEDTEFITTE
jgi:hypothetical protein